MSDELGGGLICSFNGFKNKILGLSDVRRLEAKLALLGNTLSFARPLGTTQFLVSQFTN